MRIVVIDGQGGRLGRRLLAGVREACPNAKLFAIGPNSLATHMMMGAGCADHLATGENAVIVACRTADLIVGPFGITVADAMLGEISPAMANAVAASRAYRILIPMNLCDTYIAGVSRNSSSILEDAFSHIRQFVKKAHPEAVRQ